MTAIASVFGVKEDALESGRTFFRLATEIRESGQSLIMLVFSFLTVP